MYKNQENSDQLKTECISFAEDIVKESENLIVSVANTQQILAQLPNVLLSIEFDSDENRLLSQCLAKNLIQRKNRQQLAQLIEQELESDTIDTEILLNPKKHPTEAYSDALDQFSKLTDYLCEKLQNNTQFSQSLREHHLSIGDRVVTVALEYTLWSFDCTFNNPTFDVQHSNWRNQLCEQCSAPLSILQKYVPEQHTLILETYANTVGRDLCDVMLEYSENIRENMSKDRNSQSFDTVVIESNENPVFLIQRCFLLTKTVIEHELKFILECFFSNYSGEQHCLQKTLSYSFHNYFSAPILEIFREQFFKPMLENCQTTIELIGAYRGLFEIERETVLVLEKTKQACLEQLSREIFLQLDNCAREISKQKTPVYISVSARLCFEIFQMTGYCNDFPLIYKKLEVIRNETMNLLSRMNLEQDVFEALCYQWIDLSEDLQWRNFILGFQLCLENLKKKNFKY